MSDISIRQIAAIHREREKHWSPPGSTPWSLGEHGCALAGEAGEICNKIKKVFRIQHGNHLRNQTADAQPLIDDIAGELGGLFIYMLKLADALGIDLADAIRDEFNRVSEQEGMPERIPMLQP